MIDFHLHRQAVLLHEELGLLSLGSGGQWGLVCFGVASLDLSPQFQSWHTMRVIVWVVQFVLLGAAVCFWLLERPRPMRVEGLPEPPVIHSS